MAYHIKLDTICIRLSSNEKEELEKRAREVELTVSDFIRALIDFDKKNQIITKS